MVDCSLWGHKQLTQLSNSTHARDGQKYLLWRKVTEVAGETGECEALWQICRNSDQVFRVVDFPVGLVVKHLPANAGDMGSVPGLGRFDVLWGN